MIDVAAPPLFPRPKIFEIARLNVCPAAEILRPSIDDIVLLRPQRQRLKKLFDILLMASGKSAYLSEKVKNEVLGAVAFAAPANVYFALWTTAAGTDMDAYVGNTTNFATIAGDAAKVNSNAIAWATATANWNASAVIPQLLVLDGNLKTAADNGLIWGDFTVAKAVLNGDTAQINTSALSWTEE